MRVPEIYSDIWSRHPSKFRPRRDNSRNRPKQPPVTRVCRIFRQEALPLWYGKNKFWLIHNEFKPEELIANPYRRFYPWVAQTPPAMFKFMEHVSLCGYGGWPNRMVLTIDLTSWRIVNVWNYSTYGDDFPVGENVQKMIDSTNKRLKDIAVEDGLAAILHVLNQWEFLFQIPRLRIECAPGIQNREPASGWDFDF